MALGVGAGFVLPEWAASVFSTFNGLFSGFLGFIIPLLIVGFVAPAIAEVGRGAGRMLAVTALLAYLMTFASGLLSFFTGAWIFPELIAAMVISMNIPKIYSGSNGMITVMIVRVIMSRNSPNPRRRATDPQKAMPNRRVPWPARIR